MKITKTERQKKDSSRLSVYIDGSFSFGISETDAERFGVREGAELDENAYETLLNELVIKKAKFLAMRYLSYSDRTEKEVRDKLFSYGEFDEHAVSAAIEFLKESRYLSDDNYAAVYAQSKSNRLDGPNKIKHALLQKGISKETAENALCSLETDEAENAARLIRKKLKGELDINAKKKLFDYLLRKGYTVSAINEAFKLVGSEIETEWE